MAYIAWSSRLETGITCIDRQHRRIIADINDLYEVSHRTDSDEVLAEVIDEMAGYMVKHFNFEEDLLAESGYAFIKAHERLHLLFLKHLDNYRGRFKAGESVLPEMLALLKTWWERHLANDDKDYVAAVNGKFADGEPLAAEWLSATLKMHFAGRDA